LNDLTYPRVSWYAWRLARIPMARDAQTEESRRMEAAYRAIGEEIHARWGFEGMVKVYEYYRDAHLDQDYGVISLAWDGVGRWRR
jgi:hypothetical protein